MQQLQISRGKLSVRVNSSTLLNGELFIDYAHGDKYDTDSNAYELYAGANGKAIKIGGQGVLSFIRATSETLDGDGLPTNPVTGGIYYISKDIDVSTSTDATSGKNYPEFKAGDLAVYVGEQKYNGSATETSYRFDGEYGDAAKGWIRLGNGGGAAYEITFANDNTNYTVDTIQEALVQADRTKLAYGGVKFDKSATETSVDLNNQAQISTGSTNYTVNASDLASKVKAGYYYSVGALAENTSITITLNNDSSVTDGNYETITLEEGDFLVVTSDVTTNSTALTASDLTFTKISGGTHDSSHLSYTMGARNDTYTNSTDKAWTADDAAVKTVKDGLDNLAKTKADLTAKGKIPLTQLPDTLINSMEYQGGYVINADGTFTLPTAKNITTRTDETTETTLVQGDYWIYSGPKVNVATAGLSDDVESSEGYISSGDWLVYNGENASKKWSVIDNTSPINSISLIHDYHTDDEGNVDDTTKDTLTQETVEGDIVFSGTKRAADNDGNEIKEISLDTDHTNKIIINSDNAALINTQASVGTIYKENGNKTLKATGLSESDDKLTINEANGIALKGGATSDETALSADIKQNDSQSSDISLTLPSQSGTLARLEDVGLNDGTNFYIPRFSKGADDTTATLVDSPIELIDHTTDATSNSLIGFTFHYSNDAGNTASVIFRSSESNSIQVMPEYSGFILNSNSIIDCGEWTEDGLTLANEGKQNTIYTTTTAISDSVYYTGLKNGTIPGDGTLDEIDAEIVNS